MSVEMIIVKRIIFFQKTSRGRVLSLEICFENTTFNTVLPYTAFFFRFRVYFAIQSFIRTYYEGTKTMHAKHEL